MKKCHTVFAACTAVLTVVGLGAASPAAGCSRLHVVRPGHSIQKAVDAARPGDTVLVTAGTYHESVKVTTRGLILRGQGRSTVIKPGKKKTANACAENGNGICVVGTKSRRLEGVTVENLTVTGFDRAGVFAVGTDRLTVRGVTAEKNKLWGIAEERSERSLIRGNTVRHNGDAGVFLANTMLTEAGAKDTRGTSVEGNVLRDNRIGVTVRRLRNLTVTHNDVTGNCAGVFVVGDENKPRAGKVNVVSNRIADNNKYCKKTARLPFLQGSGVVITGAEDTLVTRNVITGNAGRSPLSGGVVLYKSFVGTTSERNRVTGNRLVGNAPADVVNQEPAKRHNTFTRNTCGKSRPAGLC
ncbi:right-handed parallel beta-helix repeat-containing protein [Streptomyces sp. NPDC004542]|uniref:right-handed parallel beta-helix repeat-containing protein n=1 Tax=Streptomyces sp. NPDC004542 TaxID=3154281 RepID=UPI0033A7560F